MVIIHSRRTVHNLPARFLSLSEITKTRAKVGSHKKTLNEKKKPLCIVLF